MDISKPIRQIQRPDLCHTIIIQGSERGATQFIVVWPTSLQMGPYEVLLGQWADVESEDNLLLNDEFDAWTSSQPNSWNTPAYLTLSQETTFVEGENLS